MTIEITDEMRKVAGDAVHDHLYDKPAPDYASPTGDDFQDIGLAALTAALPIIEKAVREQCAAEIDTFAEVFRVDAKEHFGRIGASSETYLNALIDAARIVREGDHNDQ